MPYEFSPGDRVCLTPAGIAMYGGVARWIPEAQGGGTVGTLLVAADRPHKPGASPRPYYVRWDNGAENSYREDDLERAEDEATDPVQEPEEASNVIQVRWGSGSR
ncbi:hypothetical protein [Holophaga foetida]|uniref:hypothetical protein n=1 Tax=Holophaga foetida TaxID=35839 RepID=UPI0002473334|nr:hypothetical protein [Holophaga foetida]